MAFCLLQTKFICFLTRDWRGTGGISVLDNNCLVYPGRELRYSQYKTWAVSPSGRARRTFGSSDKEGCEPMHRRSTRLGYVTWPRELQLGVILRQFEARRQ